MYLRPLTVPIPVVTHPPKNLSVRSSVHFLPVATISSVDPSFSLVLQVHSQVHSLLLLDPVLPPGSLSPLSVPSTSLTTDDPVVTQSPSQSYFRSRIEPTTHRTLRQGVGSVPVFTFRDPPLPLDGEVGQYFGTNVLSTEV